MLFRSMSMERSRNDSSRDDTVSHVRHRVSLVSVPSNKLWTRVLWDESEEAPVASEGGCPFERKEPMDVDTN